MDGPAPEGQRRYSPARCIGAVKHRVEGNPDPKHVSTSYAERKNLNIRMGNRRMEMADMVKVLEDWEAQRAAAIPTSKLILLSEQAWDGHHDVVVIQKTA